MLVSGLMFSQNHYSVWKYPYLQGNTLVASDFTSDSVGYAVGENGTIVKTIDAGSSWFQLSSSVK